MCKASSFQLARQAQVNASRNGACGRMLKARRRSSASEPMLTTLFLIYEDLIYFQNFVWTPCGTVENDVEEALGGINQSIRAPALALNCVAMVRQERLMKALAAARKQKDDQAMTGEQPWPHGFVHTDFGCTNKHKLLYSVIPTVTFQNISNNQLHYVQTTRGYLILW